MAQAMLTIQDLNDRSSLKSFFDSIPLSFDTLNQYQYYEYKSLYEFMDQNAETLGITPYTDWAHRNPVNTNPTSTITILRAQLAQSLDSGNYANIRSKDLLSIIYSKLYYCFNPSLSIIAFPNFFRSLFGRYLKTLYYISSEFYEDLVILVDKKIKICGSCPKFNLCLLAFLTMVAFIFGLFLTELFRYKALEFRPERNGTKIKRILFLTTKIGMVWLVPLFVKVQIMPANRIKYERIFGIVPAIIIVFKLLYDLNIFGKFFFGHENMNEDMDEDQAVQPEI